MVVFSNRHLGPSTELVMSAELARAMLAAVRDAAADSAHARWEHALVAWLERQVAAPEGTLDVGDLAWTPDHFEPQRTFMIDAIARAAVAAHQHAGALRRWREMIAAHPRASVRTGRRWQ